MYTAKHTFNPNLFSREQSTSREENSAQGWLSVDPDANKYPHINPYNFVENSPTALIDPNGRGPVSPLINLIMARYRAYSALSAYHRNKAKQHYLNGLYEYTSNTHPSGDVKSEIQKAGLLLNEINSGNQNLTKANGITAVGTGELIEDVGDMTTAVGLALAIPTAGASLELTVVGSKVSAGGKSLQIAGYLMLENNDQAIQVSMSLGTDVAGGVIGDLAKGAYKASGVIVSEYGDLPFEILAESWTQLADQIVEIHKSNQETDQE